MKKISIRNRILLYLFGVPLGALLAIFGFVLFNMTELKEFALNTGKSLGDEAIDKSAEALMKEARSELKMLAAGQAMVSGIQLRRLVAELNNIAGIYQEIYTEHRTPEDTGPDKNVAADKLACLSIPPGISRQHVRADIERLLLHRNGLKYLYVHNDYSLGLGIAAASGVYFKYGKYPVPLDFDPRKRPWYVRAVKNPGKNVWTGPIASVISRRVIITCSRAVFAKGKLLGVAVVDVSPRAIAKDFTVTTGADGYAFLLDGKGKIIANENDNKQLELDYYKSKPGASVACRIEKAMKAREKGVKSKDAFEFAYAPIEANDWKVGVAVPEKSITAAAESARRKTSRDIAFYRQYIDQYIQQKGILYLIMITGVLMVICLLCVWLARRICVPICELAAGAERLGRGDLDVRIDIDTGDEFQDLAGSFNAMAKNLRLHIDEFKRNLEEKEHMEREMAVAANIQLSMLPRQISAFPDRSELNIQAHMVPAREVGGDFYDFFFIDDKRLYFSIGDVSGKGLPAAIFMVRALTLLRYEATKKAAPDVALANAGNALEKNNALCMFATVVCGILNVESGELELANAGHPPLYICDNNGIIRKELNKGMIIGALTITDGILRTERVKLKKGQTLFLYTDGVTEAFNSDNEMFGDAGLERSLSGAACDSPEKLLETVADSISDFVGSAPQSDDITMLSIKFNG